MSCVLLAEVQGWQSSGKELQVRENLRQGVLSWEDTCAVSSRALTCQSVVLWPSICGTVAASGVCD